MSVKQSKKRKKGKIANACGVERMEELLSKEPPKISIMTGAKPPQKKDRFGEPEFRHRIMSDAEVKYVYSSSLGVLHDKSCKCVDWEHEDQIRSSREFLPEMRLCPECRMKAYIRATGDMADYAMFIQLFHRIRLDETILRKLVIDHHAAMSVTKNVLTLQVAQDVWKLKAMDNREHQVKLLHHNLKRTGGKGERCENFRIVSFGIAIEEVYKMIERYHWSKLQRLKNWLKENVSPRKLARSMAQVWCRTKRSMMKSTFYVDGDNDPVKRIWGIERLSPRDTVKIFCARNHSYYKNPARREDLRSRCCCKVQFIPVPPGTNAVDFAIAMDAYGTCGKSTWNYVYLISGDKHFDVIQEQLQAFYGNGQIGARAETILEAHESGRIEKYKFPLFFRSEAQTG